MVLLFSVLPYFLRYGRFMNFFGQNQVLNRENGHISENKAKMKKTKGTFFSPTLKVRENKVVLFFSVLPYFLRYGRFMNFFGRNLVFQ